MTRAWEALPKSSQDTILTNVLPSKQKQLQRRKRQHRMWNQKTLSIQPITIDQSILPLLQNWQRKPAELFLLSQHTFDLENGLPTQLYLLLSTINQSQIIDSIRRRFLLLAFYKLREDYTLRRIHPNSRNDFTNAIIQSGLVEPEKVYDNCATWASAGARYNALVSSLGGKGILFLLPSDVAASM